MLVLINRPGTQPGFAGTRARHARKAHLTYFESSGGHGAPGRALLDERERMCGSLLVVEVESLQAARDWAGRRTLCQGGLFQRRRDQMPGRA